MDDRRRRELQMLEQQNALGRAQFLDLADHGHKVVGVFCGAPYVRKAHWDEGALDRCRGVVVCNDCEVGKRLYLRTSINFFLLGDRSVKVMDGGPSWLKALVGCHEVYGLDRWLFEIERHGAAGNPQTWYGIAPVARFSDELRREVLAAKLHNLQTVAGGVFNDYPLDDACDDAWSFPGDKIAPHLAKELMWRLKALPPGWVRKFRKAFCNARVRDLPASDLDAAILFLRMYTPGRGAQLDRLL